jgi:putative RNA 2'-phosphotransferase
VAGRYDKISKFLSYVLRHAPESFGLALDAHGYASIESVLKTLRRRYGQFEMEDLRRLVKMDTRGMYEIVGDRIRARYGHSVDAAPGSAPVRPPEVLYHGTAARNLNRILRDGLRAMRRQFVHLSTNVEDATAVGRRHSQNITLLKIWALKAHETGVEFYREGSVYLVKGVPPAFIEMTEVKTQAQEGRQARKGPD